MKNLKTYLEKHQPKEGNKTFNISAIEKRLDLPPKTIAHFIRGRRTLGGHESKVLNHFQNIGFSEEK